MSLNAAIVTILAGVSGLTDLVQNRIRPDQLDEKDTLPAVIVELNEFESLQTLDDAGGNEFSGEISIVCCGATRTAATALETIVRGALDGYRGTSAGVTFRPITYSGTVFDHEPAEDGSNNDDWFLNVVSFTVWGET